MAPAARHHIGGDVQRSEVGLESNVALPHLQPCAHSFEAAPPTVHPPGIVAKDVQMRSVAPTRQTLKEKHEETYTAW